MWSYVWNRNRLLQRVVAKKNWRTQQRFLTSARLNLFSFHPRNYNSMTSWSARHLSYLKHSMRNTPKISQISRVHASTTARRVYIKKNMQTPLNFLKNIRNKQQKRSHTLRLFINTSLCLGLSTWLVKQSLEDVRLNVPTRTEVDEENGFASIRNAPFVHGTYDEILTEFLPKFNDTDREIIKHLDDILSGCNSYESNFWKSKLVCEIGSGTGTLAFPIINMIGREASAKGGYIGLDISSAFVHFLDKEFEKQGLLSTNRAIAGKNTPQSLCLPNKLEGKIDIFVICDTFYHLDDTQKILNEMKKFLKKGGKLVIIENKNEENAVTNELEQSGFKLGYELKSDKFETQFVSIFKKL